MAFGKDRSALGGMGGGMSFRGNARQHSQARSARTSNGGGKAYDRWAPPKTHHTWFRLIRGVYTVKEPALDEDQKYIYDKDRNPLVVENQYPWYPFVDHYRNNVGGFVCSGGPLRKFKNLAGKCLGCEEFFAAKAAGVKQPEVSLSDKFGLSILHYDKYHKTEQRDNDGNIKFSEQTKEPFWIWVECEGRSCELCKSKAETVEGRMRPWSVGFGHWNALNAYADIIGNECLCGHGKIERLAWLCRECKDSIVDFSEVDLNEKDLKELLENKVKCQHCGHYDMGDEAISCTNSECPEAVRADLFDVDLFGMLQTSNNEKDKKTTLHIEQWRVREIPEKYQAIAKPLDLMATFAPSDLEFQKNTLEREPFNRGGGGGGAQKYDRRRNPAY